MRSVLPWLCCLLITACATPDVAKDYETKTFVPADLMTALQSDDPAARADAALQVDAMDPAERREVLLALSRDEQAAVRLMAVNMIATHHAADPGAAERLAELLPLDIEESVRLAAIEGLAASGRVEGLSALVAALSDDPSLLVRRAAAVQLDRITGNEFGAEFAARVEEAESAADVTLIEYDGWLETNRGSVRWDGTRFLTGGAQ